MVVKIVLTFENQTGIKMVKARWQLKMIQPFENRSLFQMIDSLKQGRFSTSQCCKDIIIVENSNLAML
jgi:hypothetical protein